MILKAAYIEVQLLGVPVEKWARLTSHHETIRRELDIVTTVRRDDLPVDRIETYLDVLGRRMGDLYEPMVDDLQAALHRGDTGLDLRVKVTRATASEARQLDALLDEINAFCRDQDSLITVATPSDLVLFRKWFLGQLAAQIDGDPPSRWEDYVGGDDGSPGARSSTDRLGVEGKIAVSGELDLASAADLQKSIQDARRSGADVLELDMSEVTFIDSVGLSLLVTAHNRLREDGGRLHLALPSRLRPLLDLSGLLEVLEVQFVEP